MTNPYDPPRDAAEALLADQSPIQWMLDRINEAQQSDPIVRICVDTMMRVKPDYDPDEDNDLLILIAYSALKAADDRLKQLIKISNVTPISPQILMPGGTIH